MTMKRLWKPWLYLVGIALLFNSCKKDPLPKPTQEGLNTFGCKINGKNYVPKGRSSLTVKIEPLTITYRTDKSLEIAAKSDDADIRFFLNRVDSKGDFVFSDPNLNNIGYYTDRTGVSDIRYLTSKTYTGEVTIEKLDTSKRIISGTFQFNAYSDQNQQTASITDGRFDVTY
mgnify:CR=1 FL=1